MSYLFLILGVDSFYESMIMMKLIEQMPLDCAIYCMSGEPASAYFDSDQRVFKILLLGGDIEENKALFFDVIEQGKISTVFILDYHKTFFTSYYRHDYQLIPFDLQWLENLPIPVNVIDYLDTLDYNQHNQLYLTNSSIYNVENDSDIPVDPEKDAIYDKIMGTGLDAIAAEQNLAFQQSEPEPKEDMISKTNIFPNIIKLCPPAQSQKENEFDKFIFLDYSKTDFESPDTERMKAPLGITPDKKNVVVFFSYQFMIKSVGEGKQNHYQNVLEVLANYLKLLDININLFVVGRDPNFKHTNLFKGSKINYRAFSSLSHHVYKTLISYSDVILTDTIWHPSLVDASSLRKPAGVIGSSIKILPDGSIHSDFENTDFKTFNMMTKEIQDNPQIFYQYDSFPLRAEKEPVFGFHEEKFIYYLLDLYSDESTLAFLGEFLVSQSTLPEVLNERQAIYNKKAGFAISMDDLLQKFNGL